MKQIISIISITSLFMILISACSDSKKNQQTINNVEESTSIPQFNEDSAYFYCAKQCDFGPRVMNSQVHEDCKKWIVSKFKSFGCDVIEQNATLNGYDGTPLKSTNIIAKSHKKNAKKHIVLCAHWDTRPWADNDPDPNNHKKAVLGANDGASGVAAMLEIARVIQNDTTLNVSIDFICFDAEDWGVPQWLEQRDEDSWALGAQYWSKNPHNANEYVYDYGILLDMVGGSGASFYKEGMSVEFAPSIVDKVWQAAADAGYSSYFPGEVGGYITDDHIPMNKIAGIPTIDIVPFYPNEKRSSFGPTWHTIDDTMNNIDKNTFKAVGQTVLQVLFTEI